MGKGSNTQNKTLSAVCAPSEPLLLRCFFGCYLQVLLWKFWESLYLSALDDEIVKPWVFCLSLKLVVDEGNPLVEENIEI